MFLLTISSARENTALSLLKGRNFRTPHLMKPVLVPLCRRPFIGVVVLASTITSLAQQKSPSTSPTPEEEKVMMSEFVVSTDKDRGYGTTAALGGTRVNIPLIDSPVYVTSIPRVLMDDVGLMNPTDALKYVSTINETGNGTNGQINVRGSDIRVDFQDSLPANNDATITMFDYDFFERLEVIKGPAGTMYGNHAIGGAINRVAKRPLEVSRNTITGMYDNTGGAGTKKVGFDS